MKTPVLFDCPRIAGLFSEPTMLRAAQSKSAAAVASAFVNCARSGLSEWQSCCAASGSLLPRGGVQQCDAWSMWWGRRWMSSRSRGSWDGCSSQWSWRAVGSSSGGGGSAGETAPLRGHVVRTLSTTCASAATKSCPSHCQECSLSALHICDGCGKIADTSNMTHFKLLTLENDFNISMEDLDEKYRSLQRGLHPDKFATAAESIRTVVANVSSQINAARKTLKSPLSRAKYMLDLAGYGIAEDSGTSGDQALLMEMMELREEIDSIEELSSESARNDAAIGLKANIQERIGSLIEQTSQAFAVENYDSARSLTVEHIYLQRLLDDVQDRFNI